MKIGPTTRTIAIVTVIVSAIIGSSHLIGDSSQDEPEQGRAAAGSYDSDAARGQRHRGAADDGRGLATSPSGRDRAKQSAANKPPPKPDTPPPSTAAPGGPGPVQQGVPAMPPIPAVFNQRVVVGPGQPPLLPDKDGPFGSRMTTGTLQVALTFDDGPDPKYTPEVLALLDEYQIKATFCLVGEMVVQFPALVRQIVDEGHTLCNHTWNHDVELGKKSKAVIRADMKRTNDAIHQAVPGAKISYFRHPGGAWTQAAVDVAKEFGMSSLHWTVDPQDWTKPGAKSIESVVNTGTAIGSIVLMHDAGGEREGTVTALKTILPDLEKRFALAALPPGIDPPKRHGIELPIHAGQR
ncbi:Peptidoglycan/xylan/chitin deacetylase, PgdA/CDA1 family [Asanoa hainanensis]|uniref:Peptidoglycan/xylan/chitin deacetylase, PgdA/CDA1 family n=1 Tax=Asanoa hainanensis TaxID=560556 RepID=A0A239P5V8_9ACTN|nr:polysaccharide deacetylase family protein [Asanoa hainanensis]SNT61719.1 Peptidoglycan/xylan/chitin deacetylase, PgdA/CDA1 family [Asanoa hainanensis]